MADHKPKALPHQCQRCTNEAGAQVRFDEGLRQYLCSWCWVNTPIPRGDRGKRER